MYVPRAVAPARSLDETMNHISKRIYFSGLYLGRQRKPCFCNIGEIMCICCLYAGKYLTTFVRCTFTDGLRWCVYARVFILLAFAYIYISICILLSLAWLLCTYPVNHECITLSQLWLVLMTKPVYLVTQTEPIAKSTQVCVCLCVSL